MPMGTWPSVTEAAHLPQHTGPEEADQPPSMSSHAGAPAPPSRNPCCLCWCCCCSCSWYVGVGRGGLSRPGPKTPLPDPHVASETSPTDKTPLPLTTCIQGCWVLVAGSQCPVCVRHLCLLFNTHLLTPLTAWPCGPTDCWVERAEQKPGLETMGTKLQSTCWSGPGPPGRPQGWSASEEAV